MDTIGTKQWTDFGAVHSRLAALRSRYAFLLTAPIGAGVLHRPLEAAMVGNGTRRVLMAAAFHAQEWMTAELCLRLCEELCEALANDRPLNGWDVRRAMQGRSIVLVPLVNPDGVEIALHGSETAGAYAATVHKLGGDEPGRWQANARGVDLNHNYDAGFEQTQAWERAHGIHAPAARQWGGPAPESEPETQALIALCERMQFHHAIALHSQGEEIYWHYGEHTPPESRLMAEVLAAASGYAMAEPAPSASHGGFKDWFIEHYRRPAFTVELGRGKNPLPWQVFDTVYEQAREMLITALMM